MDSHSRDAKRNQEFHSTRGIQGQNYFCNKIAKLKSNNYIKSFWKTEQNNQHVSSARKLSPRWKPTTRNIPDLSQTQQTRKSPPYSVGRTFLLTSAQQSPWPIYVLSRPPHSYLKPQSFNIQPSSRQQYYTTDQLG